MTSKDAIKHAEEILELARRLARQPRLNPEAQRHHKMAAAALRALLPIARTGMLVERTLASHREIVLWKFDPGNAQASYVVGTDMDQCGSCQTELASAHTLDSAVERALRATE